MQLVENVQSSHSSPETIAAVTMHTKKIGKVGVLVKNCDGFVGNRMVSKDSRPEKHWREPLEYSTPVYIFCSPQTNNHPST